MATRPTFRAVTIGRSVDGAPIVAHVRVGSSAVSGVRASSDQVSLRGVNKDADAAWTFARAEARGSVHLLDNRPGIDPRVTLVLAGVHGDEPKGVYVALRLLDLLRVEPDLARDRTWVIVPRVNPEGLAHRRRRNANLVDINRNFPTANWTLGDRRSRMFGGEKPAGEPETRAVIRCIERFRPTGIVTIHSIDGGRECNNYDGPATAWAKAMSKRNGYPPVASIGYPTPGSFGAWAGVERRIPTITLELPSHASRERCWRDNREALLFPASWPVE